MTRSSGTTHLATLVMSWMFLFGMIGTGLVGPNRTAIEHEFRLSHAQFGTAFALIQIACASLVLYVAARRRSANNLTLLIVSLAVQVAGFVCVYLSHVVSGLAFGWTLITLGTVLGSVSNSVSAELWPDNPRRGVTLLHGFNSIGKVAGPLVAAALLTLGWRPSFLAVGTITLVLLVAFWSNRLRFTAPERHVPADVRLDGALRQPAYWLTVLPFGLIAGGDVAFAALVPLYYETVHGLSPQTASLLLTSHLLGLVVGRFTFVALSDRLTNNLVIGLCLLNGLFIFPALLASSLIGWSLALFGVGWMFSSTWPTYYAQVAHFFPPGSRHLLDYGSGLGSSLGIALCVYASSALAEHHLAAALSFGPGVVWIFGVLYFLSPLSRADAITIGQRIR
jgi:fucose permease